MTWLAYFHLSPLGGHFVVLSDDGECLGVFDALSHVITMAATLSTPPRPMWQVEAPDTVKAAAVASYGRWLAARMGTEDVPA